MRWSLVALCTNMHVTCHELPSCVSASGTRRQHQTQSCLVLLRSDATTITNIQAFIHKVPVNVQQEIGRLSDCVNRRGAQGQQPPAARSTTHSAKPVSTSLLISHTHLQLRLDWSAQLRRTTATASKTTFAIFPAFLTSCRSHSSYTPAPDTSRPTSPARSPPEYHNCAYP